MIYRGVWAQVGIDDCTRIRVLRICDRLNEGVVIDDTGLFNERLKEWEDFYNFQPTARRALSGQTPYERLREKTRGSV